MKFPHWFRHEDLKEEIARERPFSSFITILSIEPILAPDAMSGKTFFIQTEKGKFKLRACSSIDEAKRIETNVRKLPHIFPKFYGRDGKYVLMEALQGYRNLTLEELRKNAKWIGRATAEVHKAAEISDHDHKAQFRGWLEKIREVQLIDEILYRNTLAAYERTLQQIDAKASMDLNDVHEGNMMVKDGEILFVDEGGMDYRVKGAGIGKLLKKLKRKEEFNAFMEGYTEITDGRYLTPEYIKHLQIVEAVRSAYAKRQLTDERSRNALFSDIERLKKLVG